ncbi:MAG TPA: YbdD/YjiX family protein [Steroidobacteraceae bacterium]|nr:YbdD/YjiX family protein [Steroidobacteraceae bacterium]
MSGSGWFSSPALDRLRRALRGLFGMPDYPRYLEHMQRCHPDRSPLSEREFHRHAIDRRYGASRARCC